MYAQSAVAVDLVAAIRTYVIRSVSLSTGKLGDIVCRVMSNSAEFALGTVADLVAGGFTGLQDISGLTDRVDARQRNGAVAVGVRRTELGANVDSIYAQPGTALISLTALIAHGVSVGDLVLAARMIQIVLLGDR